MKLIEKENVHRAPPQKKKKILNYTKIEKQMDKSTTTQVRDTLLTSALRWCEDKLTRNKNP